MWNLQIEGDGAAGTDIGHAYVEHMAFEYSMLRREVVL